MHDAQHLESLGAHGVCVGGDGSVCAYGVPPSWKWEAPSPVEKFSLGTAWAKNSTAPQSP